MENSWESKKILAYGKRFSVFTSIMLVLLFAFSCSNLIMNDGGSLIIAVPGARAASASSYTIELKGSNGTTQTKTVAGGTTAQFDDLAPDTYSISVKGTNADVVVLYGTSSATVSAGATASAMVKMGLVATDRASLESAIQSQERGAATIYVGGEIEVNGDMSAPSANITFQAGYENITIKNIHGNVFQALGGYEIIVGGGDYTFTIDGTTTSGGKNISSGMKINRANNAKMWLVSNGIIQNYGKAISISGNNETQKSYFNLDGGIIKDNDIGIEVGTNSVFTMTSGSIEGNTSKGVHVISDGTFNMSGGTITGGESSYGVYVEGGGTFAMSGNAIVDSSTSVFLETGAFVTVSGELTGGDIVATITPVTYSAGTQVLQAENGVDLAAMVEKFAVTPNPDGGSQWFIDTEGKLQEGVCVSDFASLENAISAGGTVYITKAITMERTLDINREVTLLSTTQSVVLTGLNPGNLFTVSTGGDFTIGDADHSITLDGNKKSSQIISVDNGGIVTLANGTITNAYASGVYINAGGTFNMSGGSITANTATNGGGVYVDADGTFDMSGGSIEANTATNGGGGVYVNTGARSFTMRGSAVVHENNDVYLSEGTTISVSDDLSGEKVARITPYSDSTNGDVYILSNADDPSNTYFNSDILGKFTVSLNGSSYSINMDGTLGMSVM